LKAKRRETPVRVPAARIRTPRIDIQAKETEGHIAGEQLLKTQAKAVEVFAAALRKGTFFSSSSLQRKKEKTTL